MDKKVNLNRKAPFNALTGSKNDFESNFQHQEKANIKREFVQRETETVIRTEF